MGSNTQHFDTTFRNSRTKIDTGRSVISFSASNRLDEEICLALKACIENEKINDIKLLQHLEAIDKGEIKL